MRIETNEQRNFAKHVYLFGYFSLLQVPFLNFPEGQREAIPPSPRTA